MKKKVVLSFLICLLAASPVFAQQPVPSRKSSKYRTIFTISGAAGGFVLGVFAGMAAYDDAINSDRKVWTAAIVTGIAGGVGGYFLGRSLDKRASTTWVPRPLSDEWDYRLKRARWHEAEGRFRYRLPALHQLTAAGSVKELQVLQSSGQIERRLQTSTSSPTATMR